VTRSESLESIHYWVGQLSKNTNTAKFISALAGNKIDVLDKEKRAISKEEIEKIAESNGMIISETSAKTG